MAKPSPDERLARIKSLIAIAESGDSRREAYKRLANEIAAYQTETGASGASIAIDIGKSRDYVSRLLKWRTAGFKTATPFQGKKTASQASHAKAWLKTASAEDIIKLLPAKTLGEIQYEEDEEEEEENYTPKKHAKQNGSKIKPPPPKKHYQKQEEEAQHAKRMAPFYKIMGEFLANSLWLLKEDWIETLREVTEDTTLSEETIEILEQWLQEMKDELEVARGMFQMEKELGQP